MKKQQQAGKNRDKKSQPSGKSKDYGKMVRAPAAQGKAVSGGAPRLGSANGKFSVEHKELLTGLIGSSGFSAKRLQINPGCREGLTWLPGIAQNFEQYRFKYLRIRYIPRCGTTAVGSVFVAFDPKASDAAPSSELILSSYHIMKEDSPWKEILVHVPKDVLNTMKTKYVSQDAGDETDLNFVGSVIFAHSGNTPGQDLGKLWLEYEVELINPSFPPEGLQESATVSGVAPMTGALPFSPANGAPIVTGSLIRGPGSGGNHRTEGKTIEFKNLAPGGYYVITVSFEGTGLGAVTRVWSGFTEIWADGVTIGAATDTALFMLVRCDAMVDPHYWLDMTTVASTVTETRFAIARVSPPPAWL